MAKINLRKKPKQNIFKVFSVIELLTIIILLLLIIKFPTTKIKTTPSNFVLKSSFFDDYKDVFQGDNGSGGISIFARRTEPGPIIHAPKISNERIELTPVIRAQIKTTNPYFDKMVDEDIPKYGSEIVGFLAKSDLRVTAYKTFDVDSDGQNEIIIEANGFGANHPPSAGYIIKNNKIIFVVNFFEGEIIKSNSGNGFYLKDTILDDRPAYDPKGYYLYRVIFENKAFKPVWEQEVDYLKISD